MLHQFSRNELVYGPEGTEILKNSTVAILGIGGVGSFAAEALDKGSQWGYLKVGRSADLAVFDYTNEPFDLTDKAGNRVKNDLGYKCILTVLDGQILYKN